MPALAQKTTPIEIGVAPPVPPWPKKLPEPVKTEAGAWLLTPEVAAEFNWRMRYLLRRPELCQSAINAVIAVKAIELEEAVDIARKEAEAEFVCEQDCSQSHWLFFAAGAGGGVLLGFVLGLLAFQ